MMNSWANIGDLVFVLGKDNEFVPCKIIKEIGTGMSLQYFFEVIEDSHIHKVPRNRLKCFLSQVGYAGGYVFKEKQNAIDYLEATKDGKKFNMSTIISKKAQRAQQKQLGKHGFVDIEEAKRKAAQDAVDKTQSILISAMLLALNSTLGIGPKRGAMVVEEMNTIFERVNQGELTQEQVRKMAEEKMNF